MTLRIKATMAWCVSGEMDHGKVTPDVQHITIIEKSCRRETPKSKKQSSNRLKKTSDLRPSPIRRTTLVMRCVKARCCNPCPCLFRNHTDIQNVIEVTMGYDNTNDAFAIPSAILQCLLKKVTASYKASVDEVESLRVTKNVKVHSKRANL